MWKCFYLSELSYYWSWDRPMQDQSEEPTALSCEAVSRRKWWFCPQQRQCVSKIEYISWVTYLACSSSIIWILSKRPRGCLSLGNLPASWNLPEVALVVVNTCLSTTPFFSLIILGWMCAFLDNNQHEDPSVSLALRWGPDTVSVLNKYF